MGTRVYIGRLPYDVRERDIEKFFKGFGRIREILMKDGFAFVEFNDHRDADDAVYDLNGKEIMGERVHVEFARGPSRGRGRFRPYGSSRSYYSSSRSDRPSRGLTYAEKYGPPRNTEYRVIVENLSSRVSWQVCCTLFIAFLSIHFSVSYLSLIAMVLAGIGVFSWSGSSWYLELMISWDDALRK